jgi:DNA-binding NarL/FixJ family response regulator
VIRLLVVDEQPVIGAGIRAILDDQPDVSVETVSDVTSATDVLDARPPDVVLCEIQFQGRNRGLDLLRDRAPSRTAFIMFSACAFPSFYAEAIDRGAAGFLPKTSPPDLIVRSIRSVAQGGKAFPFAVLDRARAARRRPATRELEIVVLVAAGATNVQIARRLVIGLPTVEAVLRRLFDRYSVPNRTALARLADSEGWLAGVTPGAPS